MFIYRQAMRGKTRFSQAADGYGLDGRRQPGEKQIRPSNHLPAFRRV
jgi:hypothetical protein